MISAFPGIPSSPCSLETSIFILSTSSLLGEGTSRSLSTMALRADSKSETT